MGLPAALLGAFCCAKPAAGMLNAPAAAPAPIIADAFRKRLLDMRGLYPHRIANPESRIPEIMRRAHWNRSGRDEDRRDRPRRQQGSRSRARGDTARRL